MLEAREATRRRQSSNRRERERRYGDPGVERRKDAAGGRLRAARSPARVWRPDVDGPSVVAVRADGDLRRQRRFSDHARPLRDRLRPPRRSAARRGCASAPWRTSSLTPSAKCACPSGRDSSRRSTCRRSRRRASPSSNRCLSASSKNARAAAGRARRRSAMRLLRMLGEELSSLKPGSPAAMRLKHGAGRGGRLVAIPGSRHRPGRGGLHQEPADVGGRLRR